MWELESCLLPKSQKERNIPASQEENLYLLAGESEKLKNLAKLLADHDYIDNPSIWLDHFNSDPLAQTEASPIKWKKTKYELYYLLKNLWFYEIRESVPVHFEGIKPPPWGENKPTINWTLSKTS